MAALQRSLDQRKSVLDFVQVDYQRLQGKISRADQARLDQHLALVREFEQRLQVGAVCANPGQPNFGDGDIDDVLTYQEAAMLSLPYGFIDGLSASGAVALASGTSSALDDLDGARRGDRDEVARGQHGGP